MKKLNQTLISICSSATNLDLRLREAGNIKEESIALRVFENVNRYITNPPIISSWATSVVDTLAFMADSWLKCHHLLEGFWYVQQIADYRIKKKRVWQINHHFLISSMKL